MLGEEERQLGECSMTAFGWLMEGTGKGRSRLGGSALSGLVEITWSNETTVDENLILRDYIMLQQNQDSHPADKATTHYKHSN